MHIPSVVWMAPVHVLMVGTLMASVRVNVMLTHVVVHMAIMHIVMMMVNVYVMDHIIHQHVARGVCMVRYMPMVPYASVHRIILGKHANNNTMCVNRLNSLTWMMPQGR